MNISRFFYQLSSLLILISTFSHSSLSHAQPVTAASRGFVCGHDICDEKRRAYVERSARWACSMARTLKRNIDRLNALKRQLDKVRARCRRNNPRKPTRCDGIPPVLRLERAIQIQQAKVDQLFQRVKLQCDSSFPPPYIPDINDCEKFEAAKYCPVKTAEEALSSVERRCEDMNNEKDDADLTCKPIVCAKPAQIAHIAKRFPALAGLAANVPSCPVPTATATKTPTVAQPPVNTATATPTPTLTKIPPTATATSTATPIATTTPGSSGSECTTQSQPSGTEGENCTVVNGPGGKLALLCCVEAQA